MKGQNTFTTSQIEALKRLINRKIVASKDEQKRIRDKIRDIYKFYFSDFSSKKGYTVSDLEELIRLGKIKISNSNYVATVTPTFIKTIYKPKPAIISVSITTNFAHLNSNLDAFKQNCFDPTADNETIIANSSGNYILCLRKNSKLPLVSIKPILINFEGLQVIYTGIAGGSLRTRDFRQHFKGNNAGRSTLRKSLGVLFGYKQIPRDKDPNTGKTKFANTDELKLSDWMHNNLIMFFLPTLNFDSIEIELINHFNPPLNLKDNNNLINLDYRRLLSNLRAQKND